MKVKVYGVRGSIPVSNPGTVKYGGNTTSLLVESCCLPEKTWLALDTGSGFVPLSYDSLKAGINGMIILYTHYHFDHTIGMTLAPVAFIKSIRLSVFGPQEHGIGPLQMLQDLFRSPYFPVDYNEIKSHIQCFGIDLPNSNIIVIHPQGGFKCLTIDHIECFDKECPIIYFDDGLSYNINECLVVKMYRSNHPERTISFRFEERPTGKVFVLLTDHENQDGLPTRFLSHIEKSDLLIMDSQYDRDRYEKTTAGYGHGTPDYCVKVGLRAGVKKLGLTHHDPIANDAKVDAIVDEAKRYLAENRPDSDMEVFGCMDYQEIEL
ncbi:MAG: MBL fold metallo-hydrolase [Firmicutes bacterium]|nr:MBL fold metallo-hydrolase [Bacillota bacterium]